MKFHTKRSKIDKNKFYKWLKRRSRVKKLLLMGLISIGISMPLMADYVAGYQSCEHKSGIGETFFIVRGVGAELSHMGSNLAMGAFLDAEYAIATKRHCKLGAIIHADGVVFHFKKKSEANKKFSELINDYKNESYVKKLIIIKRGYDENDWE